MAGSDSSALFDVVAKTRDGKAGQYAKITCACGKSYEVFASGGVNGRPLPVEPLRRKFQRAGWIVGSKRTKHTCPVCQTTLTGTPKADPPPEPTPADRRAILEALEIVFCPEKGFDDGYDDGRVAEEKNVPRKWVEDIREQLLGPIPAPPVDHIAEARAALKDLATAGAELADAVEAANKARLRVADQLVVLSKHLEEVGR
ncbi:hypothetical protein [Roseibium sediminicola]|uniref:Uncharacterized protein n=1 Tax=Roseibium sediminicola TaxID=2933272 RepID=A0ABT0H2A5_9HYPH|nr:hypothetical protein [Roseibium sp. CAU 1639]MCK7615208.1 hypothetical protein [Roseibium sp. CAU 1639]